MTARRHAPYPGLVVAKGAALLLEHLVGAEELLQLQAPQLPLLAQSFHFVLQPPHALTGGTWRAEGGGGGGGMGEGVVEWDGG